METDLYYPQYYEYHLKYYRNATIPNPVDQAYTDKSKKWVGGMRTVFYQPPLEYTGDYDIGHVYYDVACLSYPYFGPDYKYGFNIPLDPWLNGKTFEDQDTLILTQEYKDYEKAYELYDELRQECKNSEGFVDKSCWYEGTKWSMIFYINRVYFPILCIACVFTCFGIDNPNFKCASTYMMTVLWFLNLFLIIYTGVHRFNTRGTLCALSTIPTDIYKMKYETSDRHDAYWT